MSETVFHRDVLFLVITVSLFFAVVSLRSDDVTPRNEPAAWGSDHVGKPISRFTSGDECLFCHRDIGPAWGSNRHGQTVRIADPDSAALRALLANDETAAIAEEVEFTIGGKRRQRYLRASGEYGKLDLLSTAWSPATGNRRAELLNVDDPHWQVESFGLRCAGCHATAVDAKTQRFQAVSLDCFVCHGEIPESHGDNPELARFSQAWTKTARQEISVCGQCHLRGGRSRSSGLPYPHNFVAGDNLFLDFEVDFSDAALSNANPADGHILENVRDVVLRGEESVTCLTCHDVHDQNSRRHRRLRDADLCLHCHHADRPKREVKPFEVQSATCQY